MIFSPVSNTPVYARKSYDRGSRVEKVSGVEKVAVRVDDESNRWKNVAFGVDHSGAPGISEEEAERRHLELKEKWRDAYGTYDKTGRLS